LIARTEPIADEAVRRHRIGQMRHELIDITRGNGGAGAQPRHVAPRERPPQQLHELRLADAIAPEQDQAVLLK
jgi:hypothetical protein